MAEAQEGLGGALRRLVPSFYLPSFVVTWGDVVYAPVLSLLAVQLHSGGSKAAAGTAAAATAAASMLCQVPAALFFAELGPRLTLALGSAISALGSLAAWVAAGANSFPGFIAALCGMGGGRALIRMASVEYIRTAAPVACRGRCTALSGGVHRAAAIIGPLVGGVVARLYGLSAPLLIGAGFKLLGAAIFLATVPAGRGAQHSQHAQRRVMPC